MVRDSLEPSDNDWIYLAGLFDGEGCVNVSSNRSIRLSIKMADKPTMEWLHRTFGGGMYKSFKGSEGKKPNWTVAWCGKRGVYMAGWLLNTGMCREKEPQLRLAISWPLGSRGTKVSESVALLRTTIKTGLRFWKDKRYE